MKTTITALAISAIAAASSFAKAEKQETAGNYMHRIQIPCWPVCSDNPQQEREIKAYIVRINNEQPIKKINEIDAAAFRHAMSHGSGRLVQSSRP